MKKILSLVLSACMMLSAAALAEGTFTPADSYDVGISKIGRAHV